MSDWSGEPRVELGATCRGFPGPTHPGVLPRSGPEVPSGLEGFGLGASQELLGRGCPERLCPSLVRMPPHYSLPARPYALCQLMGRPGPKVKAAG